MGVRRDYQVKFTKMLSLLIDTAFAMGYEAVVGEVYRPPETAEIMEKTGRGIKNSLHTICLAVDISLFKDGVYLTKSEEYKQLGEWWESIGGAWGGRFNDGNHFSLPYPHEGFKKVR